MLKAFCRNAGPRGNNKSHAAVALAKPCKERGQLLRWEQSQASVKISDCELNYRTDIVIKYNTSTAAHTRGGRTRIT